MPTDVYDFHFAIQDENVSNKKIKEIIDSGNITIHVLPSFPTHIASQYKQFKKLIEKVDFDFVHIHMNAIVNPIPLIVCSKTGHKAVIHSHNANSNGGMLGRFLHFLNRKLFIGNINQRFVACSSLAGKWMFGSKDYTTVNNAVDISRLTFSEEARFRIREQWGIGEKTIILGTVGRLTTQKNHRRMIEIFQIFHKLHQNAKLMIVGDGPLREDLDQLVKELSLSANVIFCGNQPDPIAYFSAIDCFIMPYLFEGLAFTAIEAQANGLPIIASSNLTPELFQTNYILSELLISDNEAWVEKIETLLKKFSNDDRATRAKSMKGGPFDLSAQLDTYQSLYS